MPVTRVDTISPAHWRVPFGKFKNYTYAQMVERDPEYARWFHSVTKSYKVRTYLEIQLGMQTIMQGYFPTIVHSQKSN